jgi:two-component system, NarL family, nitrate/nitrite response regulator NarL
MVSESSIEEPAGAPVRPRVVFADDDPIVLKMLASQLADAFDCVGSAPGADEAIALVESHRPDLAILDVNMPGGGAIRATREIHTRWPETAIVILSGDESRGEVVELMNSGAITYLTKGIHRESLITKLTVALQAHRKLLRAHEPLAD